MSYNKVLRKVTVESGYNSTEIINKCNEKGMKIDKSYYSKILNGKNPAPSEEYSRLFANICGVDERLLVLEGYFDKAPKEIKECLNKIRETMIKLSLDYIDNDLSNEEINNIENIIDEQPLSDFVINILDMNIDKINNIMKLSNSNDENTINLLEPIGIKIEDNAMFPLISENSQVILKLENEYKDGDIIAIKTQEFEKPIIRYLLYKDDEIILTSINKKFETLTYKKDDIKILGKVSKVINEV